MALFRPKIDSSIFFINFETFNNGQRFLKVHVTLASGCSISLTLNKVNSDMALNSSPPIRGSRYCWARNVWAFIKQVLPRTFPSYGASLTSQMIRSVDIRESVVNNQSIFINQYFPIKTSSFILAFFYFPIIHHSWIFSTHVKGVCYSKKQVRNLYCSNLKLLIVI